MAFEGRRSVFVYSYIVYAQSILIYSFYSIKHTIRHGMSMERKETGMGKLKLFENILKAVTTLVAALTSFVKFIGMAFSMKTEQA